LGVLHAREALDVVGADDVLSGLGVQLVRHGRLGRGFGAGLGAPTAALDARPATGGRVGAGTLGAGLHDREPLVAHAGDDDRDVAGALADPGGTTASTGLEAPQ